MLLLGLGFYLAAATSGVSSSGAQRFVTRADRIAVRKAVTETLKDPESAHFRWTKRLGKDSTYCGWVNAKNSYGGYTGFMPFVAIVATLSDGSSVATTLDLGGSDNVDFISNFCVSKGVDLSDYEDSPS